MADSTRQSAEVPRASSWIDRLVGWIDDLPGSTWLFYTLVLGISVLLNNAAFWIDGGLQLGQFDAGLSVFAVYALYWIALYHFLNRHASRALKRFRPLLAAGNSELAKIDFELTALPRNLGWLAMFLGIVIALTQIPGDLANALGPVANQAQTALPAAYFTLVAIFFSAAFTALVFRTIRQLRLVGRLHERATAINLLSLDAPHAFSAFTARIGLGLILLLVIISFPMPWDSASATFLSTFDVVSYAGIALLAIAVFVVPLAGMRARLEQEKNRALSEVDDLYRTATDRLYASVRKNDYEDMDRTNDGLSALLLHRDRLDKVSTWPWYPRTIRGFTSALFLPIFLLLVAQLLERLFS